MDPAPKNKSSTDGGWSQAGRKRKGAGRGAPHRGRGTFRNQSKRGAVEVSGGKAPPTSGSIQSTSMTTAGALKPSFKAVATGEVKVNVPGWVLCTGGDPTKKTLSGEAQTLPKSCLVSLQVNGVFHNIDILRLSPQGVRAVQFLQQEIRG
jgi:hypothetical protein